MKPLLSIGSEIKYAREEMGISIGELSKRCEVSKSAISEIERDIGNPTLKTLDMITSEIDGCEFVYYIRQ